jgi:LPXTG-motif cell wall-anchored protein
MTEHGDKSMKTVRLAVAAALVAAFAVLATSPAQAYPGLTCSISDVEDAVEGEDFTVTVTVDPAVSSDFVVTYEDQTRNDSNTTSTTATFEANDATTVTAVVTQNGVSSTCTGQVDFDGDGDGDGDGDSDGDGGDGGGILPNTGGERLAWLVIGGMLVLVGGGVVVASRRRDA